MSNESAALLGQVTLGVYALLLIAGGAMGYAKAKSRPSLIAGSISGALALGLLAFTMSNSKLACGLGAVLGILMAVVFTIRLRKTGKFMPSGLLLGLSSIAALLLAAAWYNLR